MVCSNIDADGHDETGYKVTGYQCHSCGESWQVSRADKPETVRREHDFMDGVCMMCGYRNSCAHENTSVEERPYYVGDIKVTPVDESTHSWTGPKCRATTCDDCGEVIDLKVIAVDVKFTEAHWFFEDLDFCPDCGYEKPTAKPTATPAPTMPAVTDEPIATVAPTAVPTAEPVYEEVAASEVVHGVKAEDETPMVETVLAVAEAIEGESASIGIVNVEKVILPEEKAALDALPVREQLLTFLSVIGFEEQVNAAMAADADGLSAEAVALKEQIQSRIAAMDAAAYAEFKAALLESFPQEAIEIDDVEYSFFVLELEVRTGDEVRYERYGFRMEDGAWIFTRLEIGK